MNDILDIVKHLLKLGTLVASLLGSTLSGKGVIQTGERVIQASERVPAMSRALSFNLFWNTKMLLKRT